MMEPTLYQVLAEVVPDLSDTKDDFHEIMKELDRNWVKSWETFIMLDNDIILGMDKFSADGTTVVPLSRSAIRIIYDINRVIWDNIRNNVPGARLASNYAPNAAELRRCEIEAEAEKIRQRNAEDERRTQAKAEKIKQQAIELQRQAEADKMKQRHAEDDKSEKIPHNQAIRFAAERRRCEFEADAEDERRAQAEKINQAQAEEKKSIKDRRLSELRRLLKLRYHDDFRNGENCRNCEVSFPRRLSESPKAVKISICSLKMKIIEDFRNCEEKKNFQTFESARSHQNELPPAEPPPTEPPPTRFPKASVIDIRRRLNRMQTILY